MHILKYRFGLRMAPNRTIGCLNATCKPEHNLNESILSDGATLNILIAISVIGVLLIFVMAVTWARKYRTLTSTIRELRGTGGTPLTGRPPSTPPVRGSPSLQPLSELVARDSQEPISTDCLHERPDRSAASKTHAATVTVQGSFFNKHGLCMQVLLKAGREGVYYKAKMLRSTCKGYTNVTCKLIKEVVPKKKVEREVKILRRLGTHKNLLQLLDWNITDTPYILIMESVNCGTLRSFLQVNKEQLKRETNLQILLTTAAYHIAHAMLHLSSKLVIHCDLALRNIMVHSFPSEVKLTEFGLARDLTYMRSRRGIRKGVDKNKVPLRWYPPEFFQHNTYSFKGDVWSYGILLWEMETFGTLPYPDMDNSDEVVRNVCSGYRNVDPEFCRPEICQMMRSCWLDPFSLRPSFKDIVRILENILENDHDYVTVESIGHGFFSVTSDR